MANEIEIHPAFSNATKMWQELQPYQRALKPEEVMSAPASATLANFICEAILDSKLGYFSLDLDTHVRNNGYTTAVFKVANQDFVNKKYEDVLVLGNNNISDTAKAINGAGIVKTDKISLASVDNLPSLEARENNLILVDNDVNLTEVKLYTFLGNLAVNNKIIVPYQV